MHNQHQPYYYDDSSDSNSIKDVKSFVYSCQDIINKLSADLEFIKKNFAIINDQNKNEHKLLISEINQFKDQCLIYQSSLGIQCSHISLMEKEISIYKNLHATNYNNLGDFEKNEILSAENLYKTECNVESKELNLDVLGKSIKLEENLDFLFCLKFFEKTINNSKSVVHIQEEFINFKNEISEIFLKKDQMIEILLAKNKKLDLINIELRNKLLSYEEEKNKGKFCIHCHKMFIPRFNEQKSCIYHSGKLKYYSCRGCGGDEYYTCCSKCSKCLYGCKSGKHIAGL